MTIKINHVGEINTNTHGTKMKIVRYGSNEDIDIEFLDEFHYIKEHQAYSNFKSGGVKNPYDRDLYNVGYFGVGNYSSRDNGKMAFAYKTWTGMIFLYSSASCLIAFSFSLAYTSYASSTVG